MKWTSKHEHSLREVTLPRHLIPGLWCEAKVSETKLEICWEPALRTLFVRDSALALEVPLKYRAVSSQRFQGEQFCEVLLEYIGGKNSYTQLLQSEWAIHVPGQSARKTEAGAGGEQVRSPMVGKVLRVLVEVGQSIERGQELLVIEAMKMENKIFARSAGVIKDIQVTIGGQVSVGQSLIHITA
ncbi:MAG: acetyl-CoA carboxylase biotin carboxyl carrier protein subunit [Proteobacteria bacterium]|nr:acetyl-CoA carboxylase biotin carboxyl carrier protein subunit [Pseudomonadota bacterium]